MKEKSIIHFIWISVVFSMAFTGNLFAAGDMQPVSFTDTPDPLASNGEVIYSIELKNNAADTADNPELNVTVPKGFTFIGSDYADCSYSGNNPSQGLSTDIVHCSAATFSGSSSADINITLRAPTVDSPVVYESNATASCDGDINTANNLETVKTTVVEGSDLNLTKTSSPNPAVAGGIVTYRFDVVNNGPHTAKALKLTDTLPGGLKFVGDNAAPVDGNDTDWDCSTSGQEVTCTSAELAVGATSTFYFRVKVSQSSTSGDITNAATVTSKTAEVSPDDNTDTDVLTLLPGTDLEVIKKLATIPAISDQNISFTLEVTNHGPEEAIDVNVTDILPTGYTNVEASAPGWTCDVSGNPTIVCSRDASSMPVGTTETITVKAKAPHVTDIATNQNSAVTDSTTTDPLPGNNTDTVIYALNPDQSDLELTKTKSPSPIAVGDVATSVIRVRNNGPRDADPVQVVDVLSDNETYDSYNGTDWSCTHSGENGDGTGGTVTCDYGKTLLVNTPAPVLNIVTEATYEGDMNNTACTGGSGGSSEPGATDKNSANNCAAANVPATDPSGTGVADIRVIKTADDNTIDVNENSFTYMINVKNIDGNTSQNVEFRDTIPQYVSAFGGRPATTLTATTSKAGATCNITGALVVCQLGDMALNDEVNVSITVERPMADGAIPNTASAYSPITGDPDRTNNEDSATVNVEPIAEIELQSKTVTPTSVLAGTEATYTIQIRNNGPSAAEDVNVTDVFSGKPFTFISASTTKGKCDPFDDAAQTLTCHIGNMISGETQSIEVVIRPDHLVPAPSNWEINNTATVTMTTLDSNLNNNEKNATLIVREGELDLTIEKNESPLFHEPVSFDPYNVTKNLIVYKIEIYNMGPSLATEVKFSDRMISVSPDVDQNLTFKYDTANADGTDDGGARVCNDPATNPFTPDAAAPTIDCSIPELASGAKYERYLVFHMEDAPNLVTGDVYRDEINVTSREKDTLLGNNVEDEKTTVRVTTDPQIVKTVSQTSVEVGEHFTYNLKITNNGPGYSPETIVSDNLPTGMVLTGTPTISPNQGSCSSVAGDTSFTCRVDGADGTLHSEYGDPGGVSEVNITVPVMMTSWTGNTVTNSANVTTIGPDSNNSNNISSVDVTVLEPAHIGNRVWLDRDADGRQTHNWKDRNIAGIPVYLIDTLGNIVQTTSTDSNGEYGFDINHSADYRVEFNITGTNYHISPKNAGTNRENDSDINASGSTEYFTVNYGDNNLTIDAGLYTYVKLGDRVWIDKNGNGIQDETEYVKDVNVTLYKEGNTTAQASMLTDSNGRYLFDNLIPGRYYVVFDKNTLPAGGYVFTTQNAGSNNNLDSDANRNTGESEHRSLYSHSVPGNIYTYRGLDAGIYIPVSIGDYAWHDIDGNGIQDGSDVALPDVNVTLMDAGCQNQITADQNNSAAFSNPVTTDAAGAYLFDNLKPDIYCIRFSAPNGTRYVITQEGQGDDNNDSDPDRFKNPTGDTGDYVLTSGEDNRSVDAGFYIPVRIGDRVWEDKNYNGIQDNGERNVSGVRVTLIIDGVLSSESKDTNASGEYLFDDLPPGHAYSVKFSNLPADYRFTLQDAGNDDSIDSDANATGYASGQTSVTSSTDENLTFDAGIYKPVVIGDYVWEDTNANGIQDAGEPGIEGVTVTLVIDGTVYTDINTTTDANGAYLFDTSYDLKPNHTYSVQFSNLPASARPYLITDKDAGSDDTRDSDIDALNTPVQSTPTMYSAEENLTLDAGFYRNASMGNRVWIDTNGNGVQDAGEKGVAGVTVKLYKGNAASIPVNVLDTNVTDTNGFYHFDDLKPGEYYVVFEPSSLPAGYVFTERNVGNDDTKDSDVIRSTGRADTVKLVSNQDDNSTDAGIYIPVSIGDYTWIDEDGDGQQDAGEAVLAGVKVQLWNASGQVTKDLNGTTFGTNGTLETNSSGEYLFENLRPDNYYVKFEAPSSYVITLRDQGDDNSDSDTNGTAATSGQTDYYELTSGEDNRSVDAGFYIPVEVGDRVWIDNDYNGVQDATEQNLSGVDVTLYADGNFANVVATTTTDANGAYLFNNLPHGHTYSVEFNLSSVNTNNGTNYRFTVQDRGGDDSADSDANATTGRTVQTPFMKSGDSNLTLDAGVYEPVIIGDYVWEDMNGDGMQGSGEPGISGVLVTLLIDGVVHTDINTTTAADGSYLFGTSYDLKPNHSYSVQFSNPDTSYVFTQANAGSNDNNDSDADASGGGVAATPVMFSGDSNRSLDAGMHRLASIGDRIWLDTNANGIQDASEDNLSDVNVEVKLFTAGGVQVGATQTVSNGSYLFTNIIPGDYYVEFSLPAGYRVSPQDVAGNDAVDSDVNATTLRTEVTSLISGENDPSWDMGVYEPASIGDRIWLDTNADGIQDTLENDLSGVNITVTLYDGSGVQVDTLTTNNGIYGFSDLVPGDYYVAFSLPNGYEVSPKDAVANDNADSDVDTVTLRTDTTTLISGENNSSWDMGLYQYASIGDRIWLDSNADGIQDPSEGNVTVSVEVKLFDENNNTVATQSVNNGSYLFSNVVPGSYHLQFTLPAGYVVSPQDETGVNVDDSNDSDVNATTLRTEKTILVSGEEDLSWDMGIYQPAIIGDRIWLDTNGNGIQDAGEGNYTLGNVTVHLEDENNASVRDASGNPVGEVVTNTGAYEFTNLVPGTYHMRFEFPADAQISPLNRGAANTDSDVRLDTNTTADTVLVSGENDRSWDAGVFLHAGLGDQVWIDSNGNGIQDDADVLDINVTVNLYYAGNNTLADTQTILAGSNGTYSFTNVDPDDYYVEFVLPTGSKYRFIAPDAGNDDTIDSDVDINTGRTPTETILSNEFNNTLDAGIYIPASIGDRVWLDANANGIQDPNEGNISDINVTLYDDANNSVATTVTDINGSYLFSGLVPGDYHVVFALTDNNGQSYIVSPQGVMNGADDTNNSDANATGVTPVETLVSGEQKPDYDAGLYIPVSIGDFVWSDRDGNGIQNVGEPGIPDVNVTLYREENNGTVTTIGSQNTNSTGGYLFTDLVPGHYYVHFEQPDHFRATVQNSGTDDATDSDVDRVSGNTARFELFSPDDNLTLDAGFYELATISGNVSEDTDNDNIGDVNLQFVEISLVDTNGTTVAVTQTDINGSYSFTDVEPGTYTIVETQPAGLASVSENEGGDDNDPDNTTLDNMISVIVGIGEVDTGNDFVEEEAVTIGDRVWNDENGNGIQDAGETNTTALDGIVVNLYNDQEILVATTTTDANGEYLFEDYPEDTYYVSFDLSTLPAHYGVTLRDQGSDDSKDSDVAITTGKTGMGYLAPGDDNRTFDMGIYLLGVISGTVLEDTNSDGLGDTPMAGVEIILYDEQGNEVARTVTAADGTYVFRDLPQGIYMIRETQPDGYLDVGETDGDLPNDGSLNSITVKVDAGEHDADNDFIDEIGGSIGNYVWHDTNGNGVQDTDETGINAVHVCLEDSQGNAMLNPDGSPRCTDTNATGYYLFEGIIPGDYVVVFTIPQGTTLTPFPQEGTDTEIDSDPLEVIGGFASAPITMGLGEDILSVDMGLVYLGTASIGDNVWIDENRDGIFDANEEGLDGVTVNLYDESGNLVESILTHDGGKYLFEHLYAGTYVIEFVVPDALGYEFTVAHVGSGNEDSDADTINGKTEPILLREGEHIRVIDAGVYCGCENAPIKANGGNALGLVGMLAMMLMTLVTALFFIRKEEYRV